MCMCLFLIDEKGYGMCIPGKLQEEKKKKKTPMLSMMHYTPKDPGPDDLLKSGFDL